MRFRLVVICVAVLVAALLPVAHAGAQGFCFNAPVNYVAGPAPCSVFATDLDGDGDVDLVVANKQIDSVSVLKNNGDGTFAAAVNYAAGDGPISVFAGDLDGDNDADLAVSNATSHNVSVLKNNGNGIFAAAVVYATGFNSHSAFAADLDGGNDVGMWPPE